MWLVLACFIEPLQCPLVFSFWEISFTCTVLPITLKCTSRLDLLTEL